jgi:hypothetical protein
MKASLTINVEYEADEGIGMLEVEMAEVILAGLAEHALNRGFLVGGTPLVVKDWSFNVTVEALVGRKVFWTDPDDNECSGTFEIVRVHGDEVELTNEYGDVIQVPLAECEVIAHSFKDAHEGM